MRGSPFWYRGGRASFSEGALDPPDRLGDGLVGHSEPPGNRPVAQSKFTKMQGFQSDPLIDGRLQGLDQRHLELQRPGGSNTLRPGPPTLPLIPMCRKTPNRARDESRSRDSRIELGRTSTNQRSVRQSRVAPRRPHVCVSEEGLQVPLLPPSRDRVLRGRVLAALVDRDAPDPHDRARCFPAATHGRRRPGPACVRVHDERLGEKSTVFRHEGFDPAQPYVEVGAAQSPLAFSICVLLAPVGLGPWASGGCHRGRVSHRHRQADDRHTGSAVEERQEGAASGHPEHSRRSVRS